MSHGSWAHAVTLELSNESALSLQAASTETTVLQQRPAVLGVIPEWATLPGVIPGVYHHNNLSLSYHNRCRGWQIT